MDRTAAFAHTVMSSRHSDLSATEKTASTKEFVKSSQRKTSNTVGSCQKGAELLDVLLQSFILIIIFQISFWKLVTMPLCSCSAQTVLSVVCFCLTRLV